MTSVTTTMTTEILLVDLAAIERGVRDLPAISEREFVQSAVKRLADELKYFNKALVRRTKERG